MNGFQKSSTDTKEKIRLLKVKGKKKKRNHLHLILETAFYSSVWKSWQFIEIHQYMEGQEEKQFMLVVLYTRFIGMNLEWDFILEFQMKQWSLCQETFCRINFNMTLEYLFTHCSIYIIFFFCQLIKAFFLYSLRYSTVV